MKFSEFDLLSPEPLPVSGIGSVKAVTLRHICLLYTSLKNLPCPDRYSVKVSYHFIVPE